MATIEAFCNMQTNKLCLTFVNKNVLYDHIHVFRMRETTSYVEVGDDPRFVADIGVDSDRDSTDTKAVSIDTTQISEQMAASAFDFATSSR